MRHSLFLYFLFLLASIFGIAFHDGSQDVSGVQFPSFLAFTFLFFYSSDLIFRSSRGVSIINPESFFVLFYSLFHFSYLFLYIFGFSEYDSEVFYSYSAVEKAAYYCLACLCIFVIAYRLTKSGNTSSKAIYLQGGFRSIAPDRSIEIVYSISILALVIAILLFWVPIVPVYKVVFSDYRALISIGEISPLGRFFWLSQYIGYAAISLYLSAKYQSGRRINAGFSTVLLYLYILGFLLTGDRGGFISYLFICLFAYVVYERNIGIKSILIYSFGLLFVSSLVAVVRSEIIFNPIDMIVFYIEQGGGVGIVDSLNEFGVSIKTVVIAIHFVPAWHELWYGRSFVDSLMIVVPNLFSIRSSQGLGVFITEVAFGPIDTTHGRGGSIAMEAYLNFWYFGALLFALYAIYLKRVYAALLYSPTILRSVLFLSSIGAFSMWMRNTSGAAFRIILWSVVISYFSILVSRSLRRNV